MPIVTEKQYTVLLSEINTGTTLRREQLQSALDFCAYHSGVHKNADPAIRLFAVVGRETNVKSMARWLEANAPIGFKDGVAFFHEKKWKMDFKEATACEIESEIKGALPFWRVKSSEDAIKDTPMDAAELLRAVLTSIANQAKVNAMSDDKRGKRKVKPILHAELADKVAALINDAQYAKAA